MTGWTTPADLKAQVLRLWQRDELLSAAFPLRLSLRCPTSADLSERFEAVRAWIAELGLGTGYRLVWRDLRHRVIGSNRLPDRPGSIRPTTRCASSASCARAGRLPRC